MNMRIEMGALGAMLSQVRTGEGPDFETVTIQAVGVTLGTEPFSLRVSEPAEIQIEVTPSAIERYLNEKRPGGLGNFEVRLHDGHLKISAAMRLIVEIRAEATCDLKLMGQKRIEVELISLAGPVAGFKGTVEEQLRKINPVFDASTFSWDVELRTIEVTDRAVVIQGTILPK